MFREASRETTASAEQVWRVWSDVNSWPEWNPDMKESRLDGPLQQGTRGTINRLRNASAKNVCIGNHKALAMNALANRSIQTPLTPCANDPATPTAITKKTSPMGTNVASTKARCRTRP